MPKLLSVDCETTGIDLRFGTKPFFVTTSDEEGEQRYWEWGVDPLTREPSIPEEDIDDIEELINSSEYLILQNCKFDIAALGTVRPSIASNWRWDKTYDTLIAGHILASNRPHNLTDMAMQYLGWDIEPFEKRLNKYTEEARRYCRSNLPDWRIAKEGYSDMPSAKGKVWKFDTWLPLTLVRHLFENSTAKKEYERTGRVLHPNSAKSKKAYHEAGWIYFPPGIKGGVYPNGEGHPWWTVLSDYANPDSLSTMMLWEKMEKILGERDLWEIFLERMKCLPVAYRMENIGITISKSRLEELQEEYKEESDKAGRICLNVARSFGEEITLPKTGNNGAMLKFCFETLKLPPLKRSSKTGAPSLDKTVLEAYEATLPPNSKAMTFIKSLKAKRKRDTARTYMEGYKRFWKPWIPVWEGAVDEDGSGFYVLHPSLNPTGTDTLRWSSSNPNEQNISKQEGFNLRKAFGPAPGREWWSLDAKNIEARLPAYKSGERELISLYEKPDEPPYYGSAHLLNFHTVYADLWDKELKEVGIEKVGPHCKKKYASTWYQWCKNGGFAVQYGAVDRPDGKGTADRAFHRSGAHALLKNRFSKLETLNQWCIRNAEKFGYVETMPDRTVNPKRGYPLLCTRTEYGRILPTVPLNFYIQGTACWWIMRAMIKVQAKLDEWRDSDGFNGSIIMQVHDELVLDFPKSFVHPKEDLARENIEKEGGEGDRKRVMSRTSKTSNLWRIRIIQGLMEECGQDLVPSIPTPTGVEYHEVNWGEGDTL
jgi:DNA polymerase I-like protein with 3'-5' exonuclease and polymerase domains